MIVPGPLLAVPVTHGPGINHRVVEDVILIRAAHLRLVGVLVTGIVAGRREQERGCALHTKPVLGGEVNKTFGVDSSSKMIVQIAALGHLVQKRQKKRRLLPDRKQVGGGALLATRRLSWGVNACRHRNCKRNQTYPSAHHSLLFPLPLETGILPVRPKNASVEKRGSSIETQV